MNHHEHDIDAGRIHNPSVAHSMAKAVNVEMNAKILRNPNPNTNIEDVALTAGVVDLLGEPHELAEFVNEQLSDTDSRPNGDEALTYKGVSAEAVGRIAAALALVPGEKTQIGLSEQMGIPQATFSKVHKGLVEDGYIDTANATMSPQKRLSRHLTPTKKFARELAENPVWQRAVVVRKLSEKLGFSEDEVIDYALMRALEEESTNK